MAALTEVAQSVFVHPGPRTRPKVADRVVIQWHDGVEPVVGPDDLTEHPSLSMDLIRTGSSP